MKSLVYALAFMLFFNSCFAQVKHLDPLAFNDSLISRNAPVLLDVRTPGEYSKGFIYNAANLDYTDDELFKERVEKMDKNETYFIYCLSGGRSTEAAAYMQQAGFKNVYELDGGMLNWRKQKLPVTEFEYYVDKISGEAFKEMISSGVVLVDFYAPWCGPCRKMEPMLEEITKEYKGRATVIRINIDQNKNLADQLKVNEIPVLKIYKDGIETWDHRGLAGKSQVTLALDNSF